MCRQKLETQHRVGHILESTQIIIKCIEFYSVFICTVFSVSHWNWCRICCGGNINLSKYKFGVNFLVMNLFTAHIARTKWACVQCKTYWLIAAPKSLANNEYKRFNHITNNWYALVRFNSIYQSNVNTFEFGIYIIHIYADEIAHFSLQHMWTHTCSMAMHGTQQQSKKRQKSVKLLFSNRYVFYIYTCVRVVYVFAAHIYPFYRT